MKNKRPPLPKNKSFDENDPKTPGLKKALMASLGPCEDAQPEKCDKQEDQAPKGRGRVLSDCL